MLICPNLITEKPGPSVKQWNGFRHSFDWCSQWLQWRWLCCSCDPLYNKEVRAAEPYCIVGQRCHPWPIFPTGSQWKLIVDLAGICVCVFFCLRLLFACMCMCACACVYVCVTHCGQTPAHRLLVWLMNQCLQGVFEEVYCMPLFCSLKHPVLRLPPHTKEKINLLLTPPQWMASATVSSAISSSATEGEKDNGCCMREKTNTKIECIRNLTIDNISSLSTNNFNERFKKKKLPKNFIFILYFSPSMFFHFIWFLSYLWCHTCYHSCAAWSVRAD